MLLYLIKLKDKTISKFKVVEMEQNDFFNIANALKGLILRKTDEEKRKSVWNNCQWIKYDAYLDILLLKPHWNKKILICYHYVDKGTIKC